MSDVVPSPAMALTARQVISKIEEHGGRAYRAMDDHTFCLTGDSQLAAWLLRLGARPQTPGLPGIVPRGGYYRARGILEWDVWLDAIPVSGATVWEALGADA